MFIKVSDGGDISIQDLVVYNVMFYVPLGIALFISLEGGKRLSGFLNTTPLVAMEILMVLLIMPVFLFIVPFIQKRESTQGVRYSLLAVLMIGLGMTLPSIMKGHYRLLFNELTYMASYILITFIYAPEVLGIETDIKDWFKHKKQFIIVFVYVSILLLYITGFGFIYQEIHIASPDAFSVPNQMPGETLGLPTFIYYSIVTFATIGYGEILPVSTAARFVVGVEAVFGLVINVLFIAILLVFVSGSQSRILVKEEEEIEAEEKELKKEEAELAEERKRMRHEEMEIKEVKKEVSEVKKAEEKEVVDLDKLTSALKKLK
ncbi:potassium channel family protein [Nanoarchaeota archaeon]